MAVMFDTLSEKAEWALKLVASNETFAYDTETSGLDWKRNKPVGYVFTDEAHNSVYIPIRHKGGGNLLGSPALETAEGPFVQHPFERALDRAFKKRPADAFLIGHNLKFDYHSSLTAGITLTSQFYCTGFAAALLDEFARSYSLENLALARGTIAKRSEEMYAHLARTFNVPAHKDLMGRFWELAGDDPVAVDYAEGDGISTIDLWRSQINDLLTEGLGNVMRLECDLIRHVVAMERRGIKIDLSKLDSIKDAFEIKKKEALDSLPAGFNTRSPIQMKKLFEDAGITNWPTSVKTGAPSFAEKWLKTSERGRQVIQVRKLRTITDQFIAPMEQQHIFEGRVHCSLNQLRGDGFGVIAGRFSCSNPNLQQVPKHNRELAEIFRQLFIADEGYDFYEADYSQCEPRLFAHYAKAPVLIDGYSSNPPVDMHGVTARLMNADRDTVAKRMNMGMLTGMFPKTLAMHMGWDEAKGKEMWHEWFRAYPEIKDFQDTAKFKFQSTGFVKTILGRRCRIEEPRFAYRATSRIIQGSNADILKWKLLQACLMVEQMDDLIQMLLTVHDSFEWQAKKGPRGERASLEMVHELAQVQGPPFNLRVPFVMDVKKGDNWSQATFGPKLKLLELA